MKQTLRKTIPALLFITASPFSLASFTLVDDFDSYSVDTAIDNQGAWDSSSAVASEAGVVADPAGGSNSVLLTNTTSLNLFNDSGAISVANNTTATLYTRFRFEGTETPNIAFGLSDLPSPGGFSAFESALLINGTSLEARDGNSYEALTTLQGDTWYEMWSVIDNSTDSTEYYIRGGTFTKQTQLSSGADAIDFRNGTPNSLITFYVRNSGSQVGTVYFDDIYIDTTGINLTAPVTAIPEPATNMLLSGLVVAAYCAFRRRRS